jgi:uncharacterized protein (TIGR02646 family)
VRSIRKLPEPPELKKWKKDMEASPQNLSYDNLSGEVKEEIKKRLLEEQGYLCAYTLRRLNGVDDCHIEHVLPQNAAREKDLDYGNMAGCFPPDGGDTSHGYGAPVKAGIPVIHNANFVTPHSLGCEQRFRYDGKGGIHATDGDSAAENTILVLKLDHGALADLRRRAIETQGLSLRSGSARKPANPISAAQARRLAEEVSKPDAAGRLTPFCVVLRQVALEYAEKEEKRSQRLRAEHGDGR